VKKEYTGGLPVYDTLPRSGLMDRFISAEETLESYEKNTFVDTGEFAGQPYECSVDAEPDCRVKLKRRSYVQTGMILTDVILEKTVTLMEREGRLDIVYKFTNAGKTTLNTIFGSEWNINLLGGGHNDNASYKVEGKDIGDAHLDSRGVIERTRQLELINTFLGIEMMLNLDRPLTIWRYPVESLSNSEGGVEEVYQCSCLLILFPLHLEAGRDTGFQYSWSLGK
jgi:alpha-amylase